MHNFQEKYSLFLRYSQDYSLSVQLTVSSKLLQFYFLLLLPAFDIISTVKRNLLFLVATVFIAAGMYILVKVVTLKPSGKGALQVTTNIKSKVYVNGSLLGKTPLCKCEQNELLTTGEYTLRIEPSDSTHAPFTHKITIARGVLTAVERTFLPGALASAYTLTLEKNSSSDPKLVALSLPTGAMVTIDGAPTSATPYTSDSITPSEHEVEVHKQGYAKKTIRVRTVPSYTLKVEVILGTELKEFENETFPSPSPLSQTATPSASIRIGQTPTGFLRVRTEPNTAAREITRVSPGETFRFLEEQNGWFKIELLDGNVGWVSGTYAEKISTE